MREGNLTEFTHGMGLTGADHIIVRMVLLKHQPHRLHIIAGKAPVTLGFKVAET